ncbi:MAG: ABC transporter ATP-binding protein [Anaerovoracaceae bacterium]|jgi:putative ABC transport system ATP-binding protein
MEILRVENIKKSYGSGDNTVKALDGISLSVNKGDFLAIVGPSGSGKSTLLHILGGIDTPTSGRVFIDGKDIYLQSADELAIFRRREVGIIYQFYNLIPVLTVAENISLPLLMDGRKVDRDHLGGLIQSLGLADRANHYPDQLSGGQQQRVSVGRALINDPAVLLADEPTGNLDSKNSQEIIELLKQSNRKQKQTVILITHDENIALQADRLIALEDGRIIADEVMRK